MERIKILLLVGFIAIITSGCGFIAVPPMFTYLSGGKTAFDGLQILTDRKTTNDYVLSELAKTDCKTRRIFEGKKYCVHDNLWDRINKLNDDTQQIEEEINGQEEIQSYTDQ